MKSESTSKENFQSQEDVEIESLLTGISKKINTILSTLSKALEGDKVYSLNTLGHIIVPGILGSICAVLIAVYGLDVVNTSQETSDDREQGIGESIAYVFVATTAASVLTGYLVGIPTNSDRRIKTWFSCFLLATSVPITWNRITQYRQGLLVQIEENQELAEHLAKGQLIANQPNSQNLQVNWSLDTTEILQNNNQISDNLKEESFLNTVALINSNPDILKKSEIASKYFTIYKNGLEYDEELTNKGLELPIELNTIVRQKPNYLALDKPEQDLFRSSITNFSSSNDVQKLLRERN